MKEPKEGKGVSVFCWAECVKLQPWGTNAGLNMSAEEAPQDTV